MTATSRRSAATPTTTPYTFRPTFDSLIKIKEPRAAEFARTVVRNDIGRWDDLRIMDALRIIGRIWEPVDAELCAQIARDFPDAEIRRDAKRILKRHGDQSPGTA